MNLKTPILNAIDKIKLYSHFEPHIYKRGVSLYYKNTVNNVKILSDTLITANVTGGDKYDLEIELLPSGLSFRCNCLYEDNCKHSAALIEYLKNNLRNLEFDYQKIENSKDLYSSTLAFINTFKSMLNTFYGMNDKVLYSKLIKLIINNTLALLAEKESEENFDLFFTSISLFEPINNLEEEVAKSKSLLLNEFSRFNNNPSNDYLLAWKKHVLKTDINTVYNRIVSNIRLTKENEAIGLIKFIQYTIELINTNNFYYDSFSLLEKQKDVYIDKLLVIIIDILEEYKIDELLFEFLKENSEGNENVEMKYLDYLLEADNNEELNYYLENNSKLFSYGSIIKKTIEFNNKLIDSNSYINEISRIFRYNLKLENFIITSKLAPDDVFEKVKPTLLNTAMAANKYLYYEMEIYLDKDKAYRMLKDAGILVLDKHVDHYIESKEEELVLYYQEQLTSILMKRRFYGNKLKDIMNAAENLAKMKNGKYYLFSIYRTARADYNVYETTSALDALNDYLNTLKL